MTGLCELLEVLVAEAAYLGWRTVDTVFPGALDWLLPDPWGEQ